MPEPHDSTVVILLSSCVGLLFMLLIIGVTIRAQLSRLERLLALRAEKSSLKAERAAEIPAAAEEEGGSGGPFDTFLSEDPRRKLLTKKEQSTAYRKWRQQRGMNWSNS